MRQRIRTRLIFRLLGISLLPLFFFLAFTWKNVYQERMKSVSDLELNSVSQVAGGIRKWMIEEMMATTVKITAPEKEPAFKAIYITDLLKIILRDIMASKNDIEEIYAISAIDTKTIKKGEAISLAKREGKKIFVKEIRKKGFEKDERFLKSASRKKVLLSKVFFEERKPKIFLYSPILKGREVIFILRSKINLSSFKRILSEIKIGQRGYLYIFESEGRIVAHSTAFLAGKDVTKIKGAKRILKGEVLTGLNKEDRYFGVFGEKVIGAGYSIFNFGILAEWPEKEALAIVRDIETKGIQLAFLLFFGLILIAYLFAEGISKPIKEIQRGAKIIGRGFFDYRIKVKTGDELQELAEDFNKMAVNLKEVERLREAEIKRKALAKALKMEREISEAKSKFIDTVAHQLRTPVSAVKLAIEFLAEQKEKIEKSLREFIEDALSGIGDLTSLVNDLVAVSEFGFGKYKLQEPISLDLASSVSDLLEKYKEKIKAKNLKLVFRKKKEKIEVKSTKRALEFIIENLIDNAICYSKRGKKIEIEVKKEDKFALFKIKDEGIGIPRKEQKFIFSECFRASNAIEAKNVGTGLGLYLTKNIIKAHKGKIWFTSQKDKGSTFYFTLPLA